MADIRIIDFCRENNLDRKAVDKLRKKLGVPRKKDGNAWAITNENAEILMRELALPQELQSETYYAKGLHPAQNKSYMFCKIEGVEGKHPVLIPLRFRGRLTGKRFPIEKIEDTKGITWRHEWFRRVGSYNG